MRTTMAVHEGPSARALDLLHGRLDFASFSGLLTAYHVGPQTIVETKEGREIRITAKRDLSTGDFVSECERRSVVTIAGAAYAVWARTSAYSSCRAADAEACLAAAMQEVSRISVH
jgi:hypothetical protein